MPLTELQKPDKTSFYRDLQSVAGEIKSRMLRWQHMSDFIQNLDTTDLDNIGVPTGQIRTDLVNFRIMLDEIVSMFEGNAVTPTNNPNDICDAIRKMLII